MALTDFTFGPFTLDLLGRRLLRDGVPLPVAASGLRIIEALLEANGGVVTKEYLIERGWPGIIVEEGNLTVQIAKLRSTLETGDDRGEWIVTIPRVGYRLRRHDHSALATTLAPPARPSIAVLPFVNLIGGDAPDFHADGLVDDLITGLSRFRTFAVVSRNSAFVYKGRAVDARQAAAELGVRYLLEGSVRRAGNRMRITAQLIEGATGIHLWAEKFEGEAADIFDFQDRITASVIGLIEPQIQRIEIERAQQKRPDSFDAWDLYVQSVPLVHSPNVGDYDRAIDLLDRAIALDPTYCPALTMASFAHERRKTFGGTVPAGVDDAATALALAQRAVSADPNDALALAVLGWQRMLFRGEHDAGLELCERAVALNPYNRTVLDLAAVAHLFGGDLDTLIAYAMRAMTLSPGAPDNYGCITHVASAHLSARRFQESLVWAQRSIDLEPGYVYSYLFLAVANAHLGRVEDGLHALETALTIRPDLPLFHANPANRFPDRRQIMIDGYRLLGLQPP